MNGGICACTSHLVLSISIGPRLIFIHARSHESKKKVKINLKIIDRQSIETNPCLWMNEDLTGRSIPWLMCCVFVVFSSPWILSLNAFYDALTISIMARSVYALLSLTYFCRVGSKCCLCLKLFELYLTWCVYKLHLFLHVLSYLSWLVTLSCVNKLR